MRWLWQVVPNKARVLTFILKSLAFLVHKSPLFHENMVVFCLMCLLCKTENWQLYPSPNVKKRKKKEIYLPVKFTSVGLTAYTSNTQPTHALKHWNFLEHTPYVNRSPENGF